MRIDGTVVVAYKHITIGVVVVVRLTVASIRLLLIGVLLGALPQEIAEYVEHGEQTLVGFSWCC